MIKIYPLGDMFHVEIIRSSAELTSDKKDLFDTSETVEVHVVDGPTVIKIVAGEVIPDKLVDIDGVRV